MLLKLRSSIRWLKKIWLPKKKWNWKEIKHPSILFATLLEQTSWSLLGLGVEVGLTPNFMKGIHIFPLSIVGSFFFVYQVNWMCNAWS
jgi:hypothetical protein